MDGYIHFRADRNAGGRGVLIYTIQDMPCGEINNHSLEKNFEGTNGGYNNKHFLEKSRSSTRSQYVQIGKVSFNRRNN